MCVIKARVIFCQISMMNLGYGILFFLNRTNKKFNAKKRTAQPRRAAQHKFNPNSQLIKPL
jgi:hypothetical protein